MGISLGLGVEDTGRIQKSDHKVLFAFTTMPRENRKRGKRTKKPADVVQEEQTRRVQAEPDAIELPEEENTAGPSWIKPAASPVDDINYDAPFGIVDADVKAYFRTVDLQIRDWQETHSTASSEETDPNAGALWLASVARQDILHFSQRDRCSSWLQ